MDRFFMRFLLALFAGEWFGLFALFLSGSICLLLSTALMLHASNNHLSTATARSGMNHFVLLFCHY